MAFVILVCLIVIIKLLTSKMNNNKKIYCILISICFIFFAGFRSYMVGTDTFGYVKSFLNSPTMNIETLKSIFQDNEFLFYIYQSIIRTFTSNYTLFLLPIAIFFIVSVSKFIYKYSSYPAISYIMFMSMSYFTFSMTGLRQTISIGILLFAVDKLIEKKYLLSVLLILLASCFHITALSFFAILIVDILPLNKWYISIIAFLSALFYLNGDGYIKIIVDFVWGDERGYGVSEFGGTTTLILLIIVSVATLLLYPQLFKYSKIKKSQLLMKDSSTVAMMNNISYDALFEKMIIFAIPIQILAIFQANVFRISMMFHIAILALLPNVISKQKNKKARTFEGIVVVICLLIQLFVFTYNIGNINPFTFFWQI